MPGAAYIDKRGREPGSGLTHDQGPKIAKYNIQRIQKYDKNTV